MSASSIVVGLERLATLVWAEGDRIHLAGPPGVVSPEVLALLRARKAEVLAHLAGRPTWPELAAQRWGPSAGDPEPGIVIEGPGPTEGPLTGPGHPC